MKLKHVNTGLLAGIIVINAYLLFAPFFPKLMYWWQDHTHSSNSTTALSKTWRSPTAEPPKENRLIVPSMHLDEQIAEGKDMSALKNGPWRLPYTSTPDHGSNTVVVGHRYTYANPRGTFYYLDKVRLGDQIGVWWETKKYTYIVTNIDTVAPSSTGVESSTTDARLTLYTCTPLWLPKDRLVVVAKLETTT